MNQDFIAIIIVIIYWVILELLIKRRGIFLGRFATPFILAAQPAVLFLALIGILTDIQTCCGPQVSLSGMITLTVIGIGCVAVAHERRRFPSALDIVTEVKGCGDQQFRSKFMRWQFWRQFAGLDPSIEAFCAWNGSAEKNRVLKRLNGECCADEYELDGLGGSLILSIAEYSKILMAVLAVISALAHAPVLTHWLGVAFCLFSYWEVKYGMEWGQPLTRQEQLHKYAR